ncbi:MAG: thiamine phosphate synthase, partial [Alphaproteobacteria bacterium]|nr:thiamine phosphate synthase [Alphaproteobacteria bacterium]
RRRPGWLVTAAAHSLAALNQAARIGADAALLSPVFATQSHPAVPFLGAMRFAAMARKAALPVYALGGVSSKNIGQLAPSRAVGVAAISGLAP